MNMFKAVKATNVKEYLEAVPTERREDINSLHKFIQKVAPSLKPHFAYNMLGYGSFPYKNHKGVMIEWPTVALANQKNYISLYVCAVEHGEYVAEKNKSRLGKVSVGRSCIRFTKLENVDIEVLKEVIQKAAKNPGLAGAYEHSKKK